MGREVRLARTGAGLSQRAVARAAALSQSRVSYLERGIGQSGSLAELSRLAATVGLKLSIACYPVGDALRDSPQRRLIEALVARAHSSVGWRSEVPVPVPGDLRAVDAVLSIGQIQIAVEAWTRVDGLQAQLRAMRLKKRDIGADRLVMLVADTPHNRAGLRAAAATVRANFPLGTRAILAALRAGRDPGADGIVVLRILHPWFARGIKSRTAASSFEIRSPPRISVEGAAQIDRSFEI